MSHRYGQTKHNTFSVHKNIAYKIHSLHDSAHEISHPQVRLYKNVYKGRHYRDRGLFHLSSAFLYIILPEDGPLQGLTHAVSGFCR